MRRANSVNNLFRKMDEESLKRDFSAHSRESRNSARVEPIAVLAQKLKQFHGRCPFGRDC